MNNILKHSLASHMEIKLTCTEARPSSLLSRDNGRGFDVDPENAGIGMRSMRERADAIQAELQIDSQIGQGTQVVLSWAPGRYNLPPAIPSGRLYPTGGRPASV